MGHPVASFVSASYPVANAARKIVAAKVVVRMLRERNQTRLKK